MAILDCLQNVARELGLPEVTSVADSTNQTTRQMLAMANRVGEELKSRQKWPQLIKQFSFTLTSGKESYALPADIDSVIFRTHWDTQNHWELEGPLTPQEWQWRKNGVSSTSPRRKFRVRGPGNNQFLIFPTPGSADAGAVLLFEYQSENWIAPKTWAAGTAFLSGSYCFNDGNIYSTSLGGTTGATAPTHTTGTVSDGAVSWTSTTSAYKQFLADTDSSLIDETLIGLGVQWRFMRQKGLDYQEIRDDFEMALTRQVLAIQGAPTLNLSPTASAVLMGYNNIPDTGYGS